MIAFGLCRCGCGRKTTIALQSDKTKGHVRGQPKAFVKSHRILTEEMREAQRERGRKMRAAMTPEQIAAWQLASAEGRRKARERRGARKAQDHTAPVVGAVALYRSEKLARIAREQPLIEEAKEMFARWKRDMDVSRKGGRPKKNRGPGIQIWRDE